MVSDRQVPEDVMNAVAEGRKVVAIKLLREATGLGLANAKVIVDRLAAEHARSNPTRAVMRESAGARRMFAITALIGAVIVAWRYLSAG